MSSKSGLPRSNGYRGALKRVFAVFSAALGRGWRHRLLIRRLIAATTVEMLGTETLMAITRLYGASRLFVNFFQPSFKLAEKHRDGAKVTKRYHG
jgi:hypothetical protein